MRYLFDIKCAFSFFSILPMKFEDKEDFSSSKMILFLPLVGVVLGFISIFPFIMIQNPLFAIFSAFLYLFLYGFLHLEAVVDVVDAVYAKMSGKDAYKIIKEPSVGAVGVLWGVSFLLLKVAGFSYLLLHGKYFEIVAILTISRASLVYLIVSESFKSSFVDSLKNSVTKKEVFIMMGLVGLVFIKVFYLFLLLFGVSLFLVKEVEKRLGFKNGDVLGFVLESVEIVGFLSIGAFCGI